MGGEPLLHSDFATVFALAQARVPKVAVFTNGTVPFPTAIKPRKDDAFIFNFLFQKTPNFRNNIQRIIKEKWPNQISFEIVLREGIDIENLKRNIQSANNICLKRDPFFPKPMFVFSFDCTSNILEYKQELNERMIELLLFARSLNLQVGSDHNPPYCFVGNKLRLIGREMKIFSHHRCSIKSAGLITADFNIQFCGIFPRHVGNLFDGNGRIIGFQELSGKLEEAHSYKLAKRHEELCKDCNHWLKECNSACFPKSMS
jgi:hypothetical protein